MLIREVTKIYIKPIFITKVSTSNTFISNKKAVSFKRAIVCQTTKTALKIQVNHDVERVSEFKIDSYQETRLTFLQK